MPAWISRRGWLEDLQRWLGDEQGIAACARAHLRTSLLLRVAEVLAAHADHGSGRHCAITNAAAALAAGCSPRTVTTVRRLLAEAGLAIEIRRGTGAAHAPAVLRRPSIWHLVSRKVPVDKSPVCDLPPPRSGRRISPVGTSSPSAPARTQISTPTKKRPPRLARRSAPRPLAIQKLAAGVISRCNGFSQVHPGHICEALTRSGLDLDAWSAKDIATALNAHMRAYGWSWPDRIERPGAFLASRLRHLPKQPVPAHTASPARIAPDVDAPTPPAPVPASAGARAAARAYFQQNRGRSTTGKSRHQAHWVP